ncbi:serine protease [Streptomyces sp. LRE541]|uniref:trypsin-like peptidase domain-containing protein n=1 Tax=Streptomyces sp. LRE541 TaxID=2931983 RepID=UPI00200C68CC|nr:trypsin-like peptidase domain-containing protein [Streptomyces sp. LRE541]UPZ28476.1 serine protease [Streptomyces sp. LRE541]
MRWTPSLTALNRLLAMYYPKQTATRRVAEQAGLPLAHIAFTDSSLDTWYAVLREASLRGMTDAVVGAALEDFPDDPLLQQARLGLLTDDSGARSIIVGAQEREPTEADFIQAEALMAAQSTLLPVHFLARGQEIARSVALLQADGQSGTGFLIADNLLITNHHVLPTPEAAERARAIFGYELGTDGREQMGATYRLQPEVFYRTSPQTEDDWTVVAMAGNPNRTYGAIEMIPVTSQPRYVNIIQHPFGSHKQLALHHNAVVKQDERLLYYLTDTHYGSSGAPVFDHSWHLVALHRGIHERPRFPGRPRIRSNVGTNIVRIINALR